jgi:predicted extracellular nuclease
MRSPHFVFAVVLLLAASQGAFADDYVRIGSWNIEHLGKRAFGQHPKALAEHIELAAVDVLALQEIYDTDENDATRTNERLDAVFALINEHEGQDWAYTLLPKRQKDETYQLVGVAWNRHKVSKVGEFSIPVEYASQYTWNRHPHAVKFSAGKGKTDFVVIPLHMKSNSDGVDIGREARAAEAAALVAKLDKVRQHFDDEQDIIIIGDTNCLDAAEDALSIYSDAGFVDLNAKDAITYRKASYASPFDRILVPAEQAEFKYTRQYVLTPTDPQTHLGSLSDHFLVKAAVRVLADDDGDN